MDKPKIARAPAKPDLTLDDLRTVNGLPKVPLADPDRAAARADAIAAEAGADRARLDAARPALLLTGTDAQLAEHDDAASAFARTGERAEALGAALRARAEIVRGEMAEAARVERYDAAAAVLKDLPAAVEADYRELVRLGRSIVERIARADAVVHTANRNLPAGRPDLPDAEGFRYLSDEPAKVIGAKRMKLYVDDNGRPLEDQFRVQPRWSVDADGRPQSDKSKAQNYPADLGWNGRYKDDGNGNEMVGKQHELHVRRWDFVEYEVQNHIIRSIYNPVPFARSLKIPPLRALQPSGWAMNDKTEMYNVLNILAQTSNLAPTSVPDMTPNPTITGSMKLELFETRYGALSELGIPVEDVTAEACRRRSSNPRDDDFTGSTVGIGYRRGGHGSSDAPAATRMPSAGLAG